MNNNTKAVLLEKTRKVIDETAFFGVVLWHLLEPVPGSAHLFKYRLALVIKGECVLPYDNERGKGDHRHMDGREDAIAFTTLEALFDAFRRIWKGFCHDDAHGTSQHGQGYQEPLCCRR